MLDTLRAFVALNLDVGSIRRVAVLQRSLRTSLHLPQGAFAWASPTNLHVPVRVLGEIDEAATSAITDLMRAMVEPLSAVRVQFGPLEAFPSPAAARLMVVGLTDATAQLANLADQVEQMAARFGLPAQARPFLPVLVLARMAQPVDATQWLHAAGTASLGEARVTELVLYRTEIKTPGAEYTALGRVPVAAPQATRSQRPSRAPKASQRPRSRSKPPVESAPEAPVSPVIPKPPRLPSVPSPAPSQDGQPPQAPGSDLPPPPSKPFSAPLPPELEAALPSEDEWK